MKTKLRKSVSKLMFGVERKLIQNLRGNLTECEAKPELLASLSAQALKNAMSPKRPKKSPLKRKSMSPRQKPPAVELDAIGRPAKPDTFTSTHYMLKKFKKSDDPNQRVRDVTYLKRLYLCLQ